MIMYIKKSKELSKQNKKALGTNELYHGIQGQHKKIMFLYASNK